MPIGPIEKKCDAVIRLTKSQQARLGEIAGALHCYSGSGPTTGQPSWRTMVGGIADGVLRVTNPKAKREDSPPKESSRRGGKKNKRELIPGTPAWWKPFYGNAMGQEYALKSSGLTLTELLAMGMRSDYNQNLNHPEVIVGKPEWPTEFSASRPHWWWIPDPDGAMEIDAAVAISELSVEQIVAGGMIVDLDLGRLFAPDSWDKWNVCARRANAIPFVKSAPDWFVPCGIGMAMPLSEAIAESKLSAAAMIGFGIRIKKINSQKYVTGPSGSDWDINMHDHEI